MQYASKSLHERVKANLSSKSKQQILLRTRHVYLCAKKLAFFSALKDSAFLYFSIHLNIVIMHSLKIILTYSYSLAFLVSQKLNELNTSKFYTFSALKLQFVKKKHFKIDSNRSCSFYFKNQNHAILCYKNLHNLILFLLTMLNV